MWRDFGVSTRGCVELNKLLKNVDYPAFTSVIQHPVGLGKMSEMVLAKHLMKETRVRASDWEQDLSNEQIHCECISVFSPEDVISWFPADAANDAACSLAVFLSLKDRVSRVLYEEVTGEFDVVDGVTS